MTEGYIRLWRKVMDSYFYTEPDYAHLWIHLLLKANHKNKFMTFRGKPFLIKRGQFVTSRAKLVKETGLNRSKIERILKSFESEQQIEQQNFFVFRLITVVNYNKFQKVSTKVSSECAASEQPVSTTNKLKNDKNDNKKKYICASGNALTEDQVENSWKEWWKRYPRKEDKGKAREKYMHNVKIRKVDPELLDQALTGYIHCLKSKDTDIDYVKHAKTFLYPGNPKRDIPPTWQQYVKYAADQYKPKPRL